MANKKTEPDNGRQEAKQQTEKHEAYLLCHQERRLMMMIKMIRRQDDNINDNDDENGDENVDANVFLMCS